MKQEWILIYQNMQDFFYIEWISGTISKPSSVYEM